MIRDNYRLSQGSFDAWKSDPFGSAGSMIRSLTITVPEALRPGSEYAANRLVAQLPWKGVYDWVFSGWRYVLILFGAVALIWMQRGSRGFGRLLRRFGWFLGFYALIAAPVMWSNRFIPDHEADGPIWTDATRLKMFLEVPMVALVAYALWSIPGVVKRTKRGGNQVRRTEQSSV